MLLELLQTHIAAALLAFTPPHPLSLSDTLPPWRDPSPHRELHIRVGNAVQLEVLDWGGPGKPLVFLAGGGEAAHVYDGFAPASVGVSACWPSHGEGWEPPAIRPRATTPQR
ncbi:MAG: hypothetical protein ACJ8AP_14950 [Gemmatimonadales bacterium]